MRNFNALSADVKAENKANKYANELRPKLLAVFTPLLGSKILKGDGCLLKKIQESLPSLTFDDKSVSVYRLSSNYSLGWTVKVCEKIPDKEYTCTYRSATVYIGDLEGGTLKKLHLDKNPLKEDYVLEDIVADIKTYKAAKAVADAAESKLFPFTDYKDYI